MSRSRSIALLVIAPAILMGMAVSVGALQFLGVEVDEIDKSGESAHVFTTDGTKWAVLLDKEKNVPFFLQTKTMAIV